MINPRKSLQRWGVFCIRPLISFNSLIFTSLNQGLLEQIYKETGIYNQALTKNACRSFWIRAGGLLSSKVLKTYMYIN